MTNTTDKELRALAEAATPGPWEVDGSTVWVEDVDYGMEPDCCGNFNRDGSCCGNAIARQTMEQVQREIAGASDVDAAFIAAANPQTVLGLLDRIAGAEQRGPLWCQLPEGSVDGDPCPAGCPADGACRAVYLRKSEAVAECEEIASLKAELSATRSQLEGLTEALGIIAMASGMPLPNPEGVLKSIKQSHNEAIAARRTLKGDEDNG